MHSTEKTEDGCEGRGQMTVNAVLAEGMEQIFLIFFADVSL